VAVKVPTLNIQGKSGLFTNNIAKSHHFQNKTSQIKKSQIKAPQSGSSKDGTSINKDVSLHKLSTEEITQYLQQAAQLHVPTNINIENINYYPFSQFEQTSQEKPRPVYSGKLSVNDNILSFSIDDKNKLLPSLFSTTLTPKGTNFTATVNTELFFLQEFLTIHQIPLPVTMDSGEVIHGRLNSQIQWQNEALIIDNQLNNVAIDFSLLNIAQTATLTPPATVQKTDLLHINATLAWKMHLTKEKIDFDFEKHSRISLNYSDEKLAKLFLAQSISPKITALLTDNPTKGITILPFGNIKVNLVNSTLLITELTVKTLNTSQPTQVEFADISFDYGSSKTKETVKNKATFTLDSQLNMAELRNYSSHPINIHTVGTIEHSQLGWQIHLTPATNIELTNISLTAFAEGKAEQRAKQQIKEKQNKRLIKSFSSLFQGVITINNKGKTTIALTLNSQANLLQLSNNMQINKLQIIAKINSDFDNVDANASIIADNVEVTKLTINGELARPFIQLSANNILLTDLLSLQLALPVPVELIDGEVSYYVKGQLTDIENLRNNEMSSLISLKSVTGKIDDTWLQELNWQQKFILKNNQVKTLLNDKNNLNIELIELASPITNLSLNTQINSQNNELALIAKDIQGEILGGSFSIPDIRWPINTKHSVNVQLTNIDLEEVLALDQKQGIVVTGRISGLLPLTFDGKNVTIEQGELHNISRGLIQVINNPAVEELKTSNSQLKLAFDALQNLHYHQLSSDVSMRDDGYMLLETIINGRNPDLDNDVNLNLNLSYDLLGLLESMSITERLEQNIIKDLQKH